MERLTVCWGSSMFTGKSEEAAILIDIAERVFKKRWACIRPFQALRPGDTESHMKTHGERWIECFHPKSVREACILIKKLLAEGIEVLWIEEPFLWALKAESEDEQDGIGWDIYAMIREAQRKVPVIVSTLTKSSELEPLPGVHLVLAVADEIQVCSRARCTVDGCGRRAERSWHLTGKEKALFAGGSESFTCVCIECWNKLNRARTSTHATN